MWRFDKTRNTGSVASDIWHYQYSEEKCIKDTFDFKKNRHDQRRKSYVFNNSELKKNGTIDFEKLIWVQKHVGDVIDFS